MSISRDAVVDYADIIAPDAKPVGPIHPGVILEEEFLEPLGLSAYALAKAIGVPRNRITGILRGERAITADAALRLGRFFASCQNSGSGCRWTTTSRPRAPRSAPGSNRQ